MGRKREPMNTAADWRTQLTPYSRRRLVNKIMKTLERHLHVSAQEAREKLKNVAVRFEGKIFDAATSKPDYLHKISLHVPTLETKCQNLMTNSIQPNATSSGQNAHGPASFGYTAQMGNANGADWQEEIYQKIMSMKEISLPELNDLFQRIASKVQQAKSTCASETDMMGSGQQGLSCDFDRLDGSFDGLGSGWNGACVSSSATSCFGRLDSSCDGLSSGAKLDQRLAHGEERLGMVEERLEKLEAHSEKMETLLVDINKTLNNLVRTGEVKVCSSSGQVMADQSGDIE